MDYLINLQCIQREVAQWTKKNFGHRPAYWPLLGVSEEVGELCHAHLKQEQGIRGTATELEVKAKDAVGDIVIYLISYCDKRGWDFEAIISETWRKVSKRDWAKQRENNATQL